MKKTLTTIAAILLLTTTALALILSNEQPQSGSTIPGGNTTFSIDTDTPATSGTVYVQNKTGNYNPYSLNCTSGTNCWTTININLQEWDDLTTYNFYFVVDSVFDPPFPGTHNFTLNTPPTPPTNLTITGINETALLLTWDNATEPDVNLWKIYRSNQTGTQPNSTNYVGNTTTPQYVDNGLTTGETYYYVVTAVDSIGQESQPSAEASKIVADSTPPVEPTITPPSGSTVTTTTPTINIDYTAGNENVSLKIYSGTVLIQDMGTGINFTWTPNLVNGTTYSFTFNATDVFGNTRQTDYTISVSAPPINISVIDTIHITATQSTHVKTQALPGDYLLLNFSISMYGGSYVRARMDDLVSATDVINITGESQPKLFCEEDYDPTTQDITTTPTKNVYDVQNSYDETQPALNCQDTNPSDLVEYNVYLKIPIPHDKDSGSYTGNVYFGMYDTVI